MTINTGISSSSYESLILL